MTDILQAIVAQKKEEVKEKRKLFPVPLLERSVHFNAPVVSLSGYLQRPGSQGVIAEFKRRSPSRNDINLYADVERTSIGYMMAGASALSILTDTKFFGGSEEDLRIARKFNFCPILRKDFIIDEYQVLEARGSGADAILLIAAILTGEQIRSLAELSRSLGMEVVLEIHDACEIEKICEAVNILGVNNRNLRNFNVDLGTSECLAAKLPSNMLKIAESGIRTPEDILRLRKAGYRGFLMGELFMQHGRPEKAAEQFIRSLKELCR